MLKGDRATLLLFNQQGFIVGIASGIPKNCKQNLDFSNFYLS